MKNEHPALGLDFGRMFTLRFNNSYNCTWFYGFINVWWTQDFYKLAFFKNSAFL